MDTDFLFSVILFLTVYKHFCSYREMRKPIVHIMYRDGVFYIVSIAGKRIHCADRPAAYLQGQLSHLPTSSSTVYFRSALFFYVTHRENSDKDRFS